MEFRWPDGVKAAGKNWQPDSDLSREHSAAWYSSGTDGVAEVVLAQWDLDDPQPDEDWTDEDHELAERDRRERAERREQEHGTPWQTGDMSPDGEWTLTRRGWAAMDDVIYEEAADFFGEDIDSGGMEFPMTFGDAIEQGWWPGPRRVRRPVPREVAEPTPWEHEAAKRSFKEGYEQGYADAIEDAAY